jgi:ParB-like nuclease domain
MKASRRKKVGVNGRHEGDARIVQRRPSTLKPSPENELLYRERTPDDAAFARFVESIRKDGVQAPLLVSSDGFIISGHLRRKGALAAGVRTVPVIVLNFRREDHTSDEWLAILREHNTGREKTFDELVREKLVDIDPNEAISQIVDDEVERTRARVKLIEIGTREMKRYGISKDKRGMAEAILEVLRDLCDYLPVSLRAIHYRLLVKSFSRHLTKKTPYENDLASYHDLSDMATRMRIAGEIPWNSICDETRPVTKWRCWRNAADFIAQQSDRFLRGYARDLLQSQAQHFEAVVEKLTVKNFVDPIAGKYCMPVVIMRGNSGIDTRYQIVQRFRASGKARLFLFCLGDCDPDGDSIVDSTLRSLRDDFEIPIDKLDGTRVAMTHAQADALHLPRMLEAKKKSPNYTRFIRKHGRSDCYELEAVAPEVEQGWLDSAIRGVIDIEAYNHEVQQQTAEASGILAKRQAVLDVMRR